MRTSGLPTLTSPSVVCVIPDKLGGSLNIVEGLFRHRRPDGLAYAAILTHNPLWTDATTQQRESWHRFALASFLLGASTNTYFNFVESRTWTAVLSDHRWDHVDVGLPTGPYAKVNGVYQRNFTKGLVLVNPTPTAMRFMFGSRLC